MTFNEIAPEINSNQTKLLLRELLGALPKQKPKMTYAEASKDFRLMEIAHIESGYNQCLTEVIKALTDYLIVNRKPIFKEPLRQQYPELNSYQIAKLRKMLADAKLSK